MQTLPATTQAATHAATSAEWQGLPYWVQLSIGFLLIGIGASIAAAQLRAAIPPSPDPKRKAIHYLYAPLFGSVFACVAWPALPGFGWETRWLIGLVAPFLWAPIYSIVKERYEKQLGIKLPEANSITGASPPQLPTPAPIPAPPTTGG